MNYCNKTMRTPMRILLCLALLLCCASCSRHTDIPAPQRIPIAMRFGVASVTTRPDTRGLINNIGHLQQACTQDVGNEAIGFWMDYVNYRSTPMQVTKDFLGQNQQLKFEPNPAPGAWDFDHSAENAHDAFWLHTGRFLVRAFYPQRLQNQIVSASADALLLPMEYNTHINQEDLMVASNEVIVDDDADGITPHATIAKAWESGSITQSDVLTPPSSSYYGYSTHFALNSPVPLQFVHALAAIQIRFKADFLHEDKLLAVEFYKTQDDGFCTTGIMRYGDEMESYTTNNAPNWTKRDAIGWTIAPTDKAWQPFYRWIVPNGTEGNEMWSRQSGPTDMGYRMPVAYTRNDSHYTQVADAQPEWQLGTRNLFGNEGLCRYNANDGWLLVIPQELDGHTCIRATFKELGVIEAALTHTGTDEDGTPNPLGRHLLTGRKYLYTLRIRGVDAHMEVVSTPWDEWSASHEIIFESADQ